MISFPSSLYFVTGAAIILSAARITHSYLSSRQSVSLGNKRAPIAKARSQGRKGREVRTDTAVFEGSIPSKGEHKPQQIYTNLFETPSEVKFETIGYIRTPYKERFGTPRQANVTSGVLEGKAMYGEIFLNKKRNFDLALEDLDGYEYIWLISYMHLNQGWNPKVIPPRGPRIKRGLFSTRSPHRPNSIAISACKVVSVDSRGLKIVVDGVDLLDGTPLLDIKPYIPYCDAFPNAKMGWLSELSCLDEVDYLPCKPPPFIK